MSELTYNIKATKPGEEDRHVFFIPANELSNVMEMLNAEGWLVVFKEITRGY